MHTRLLGAVLGAVLATLSITPVFADTTGGGFADLGLDSITMTGGSVNAKTGIVTVHGTITCSQDVEAFAWVDARQTVGRFHVLTGGGAALVSCEAATGHAAFDVTFEADQGKFAPGRLRVAGYAEADSCDSEDTCVSDVADFGPVTIRIGRR
jgi:hypothetical protein